jgi:hypothetical protein
MSQKLLEETAEACGGVVLRGFPAIHLAFRSFRTLRPAEAPLPGDAAGASNLSSI